MKLVIALTSALALSGCATIVNDPYIPLSARFSDGSAGVCNFRNKRGSWHSKIPSANIMIRRSDDALIYDCTTENEIRAVGSIRSETEGGKFAASIVFWDLGITDAITDKHRTYQGNIVIPVISNGSSQVANEIIIDDRSVKAMSNAGEKLTTTKSGFSVGQKNTYSKTYPLSNWDGKWTGSRDGGTSGDCSSLTDQQLNAGVSNGSVSVTQSFYDTRGFGTNAHFPTKLKGSITESSEIIIDQGDTYLNDHFIFTGSYNENKQRLQGAWVHDECEGKWWLTRS